VKTLPRPARSTVNDLDTIIARARKLRPTLDGERQNLIDLFTGYTDDSGWDFDTLQDLGHLPDAVRNAMRRSYGLTYPGRALADLRNDLLSVKDNLCPYCRLLPPTTLDHFLAKSRHEVFAAFAPNLVPMCAPCNTYKGTKGSARARQFFTHAYFDQLAEAEPFLVAQVAVGKKHIATNFTIDFSANLEAHVFQRLAYQMTILRLVPRYQLEAVDIIYDQAVKLQEMDDDGCTAEECRLSLAGDAKSAADQFGASYWKAALLVALAANSVFCGGGFKKAL
jgi:hypothetical protein